MTVTYRRPYLAVVANGVTLTDVISCTVRVGVDSRVAVATIEVVSMPALFTWDPVVITMGASQATAAVRFTGSFISSDRTLWPKSVTLSCKGKLALAELLQNPAKIDLSNGGTGATDQVLVSTVLYHCHSSGAWTPADAPTAMTGIEGTGKTLGTVAGEDSFSWWEGATGLAFIDALDKVCLGYRIYDTFDGTIKRTQISTIPSETSVSTFTEGVDIAGATESLSVIEARNKVLVEGYPGTNADEEVSYTAYDANPFLMTTDGEQWYLVESTASGMIERALSADAGDGLSCQEVAEWLLGEKNRYRQTVMLTTPRDDVIEPGQTITVNCPSRLGIVSRRFWVKDVAPSINENGRFIQSFTCMANLELSEGRNASVLLKTPMQAAAAALVPVVVVIVPSEQAVTATATAWALPPEILIGALVEADAATATAWAEAPGISGHDAGVTASAATATAWALIPEVTAEAASGMLLESGDDLLLESEDRLLLE